jgi:hypothetical protein
MLQIFVPQEEALLASQVGHLSHLICPVELSGLSASLPQSQHRIEAISLTKGAMSVA